MEAITRKKKLIEVALPLDDINKACVREKSIRHGHPSTLHLWWARRPLAAARAVIFAQMVDDPSEHPELFPTQEDQERERQRLFDIIRELVQWENTTNQTVLETAHAEIMKSWRMTCAEKIDHPQSEGLFDPEKLPAFCDPFAGGGCTTAGGATAWTRRVCLRSQSRSGANKQSVDRDSCSLRGESSC